MSELECLDHGHGIEGADVVGADRRDGKPFEDRIHLVLHDHMLGAQSHGPHMRQRLREDADLSGSLPSRRGQQLLVARDLVAGGLGRFRVDHQLSGLDGLRGVDALVS